MKKIREIYSDNSLSNDLNAKGEKYSEFVIVRKEGSTTLTKYQR